MSDTILTLDRLCVGYGDRPAAADVSFSLQRGEILCLVGESGCGKSTLLKALMAAPEIRLFSGSITLEGTELSALPPKQRHKLCCEKMGKRSKVTGNMTRKPLTPRWRRLLPR